MYLAPRDFLSHLFQVAVDAADPMQSIAPVLPPRPKGRLFVIGAGKASARMAEAVEEHYGPCKGLVITRYGYERATQGIEIVQAGHPIPDQAGIDATRRMMHMVRDLNVDDLVIALISGGGSSLLCSPVDGVSLQDKIDITAQLLASGAPIADINTVRRQLSLVKGGKLAAACAPAEVVNILISDVPGDEPALIASGPTIPNNLNNEDVLNVVRKWKISLPLHIRRIIKNAEPANTNDLNVKTYIVAAPAKSLKAAAMAADSCRVQILGDAIEGEARDVARQHVAIALEIQATHPKKNVLLLSGGECTVTKSGNGVGGPNAEYTLAAAHALSGANGVHVLACDTDGVDGGAEVAGAYAGPETLTKASELGLDAQKALNNNDAHEFFKMLDSQIVTGPTFTNVNDFRAILITPNYDKHE